jgi:hypothetical protein
MLIVSIIGAMALMRSWRIEQEEQRPKTEPGAFLKYALARE